MKVAVIGTGYVGLVAGACLAESGARVICVDIDQERINQLKSGIIPIYEPDLETLVKRNFANGNLNFTIDTKSAVQASEIIFLAVPTPSDEDGSADLRHILEATQEVAQAINGYKIIVDKSTVPVGTAARVRELIGSITSHPFDVVSNPEFLKEGAAVDDFMKPDRIVIGTDSPRAENIMRELYAPFSRTRDKFIIMRPESAELTKYAANSLLALKISFMNEIALLCEKVGADVNEVRLGIGSDERIGPHFLFPGLGFGGSCFPKDLRALDFIGKEHGLTMRLVENTIEVNRMQKQVIPGKIQKHFGSNLEGLKFAVWGLAFKAKTDDVRESPALAVVDYLLGNNAEVRVYDPEAMDNTRIHYEKINKEKQVINTDRLKYAENGFTALQDADALVIATDWEEFKSPDFNEISRLRKRPVVFDGRNLFNPKTMKELGFVYYGIGVAG